MDAENQKLNEIRQQYFEWLVLKTGLYDLNYHNLLYRLYRREFTWSIHFDANRAADGFKFREEFGDSLKIEGDDFVIYDFLFGPPNVLEVLIGVVVRLQFFSEDKLSDKDWWLILLINLGLAGCNDMCFPDTDVENQIERALLTLLERKYNRWGHGGLFPVDKAFKDDMRTMELWNQMHIWLQRGRYVHSDFGKTG